MNPQITAQDIHETYLEVCQKAGYYPGTVIDWEAVTDDKRHLYAHMADLLNARLAEQASTREEGGRDA